MYDGLKKGYTFPLHLFKNKKTRANMRFYKNNLHRQVLYSIKEKQQSCLPLAPGLEEHNRQGATARSLANIGGLRIAT